MPATLIGEFAIALVIYGTGVHIANVIEIYSREQRGIEEGDVYNLVYFLDEGFSHYLQFVPLFFVIGWFVIHDRPRLGVYPTVALFLGAGHGVERAIGIIEGGKWFLGAPTIVWIGAAAWIRGRRLQRFDVDPRDDFFFRYAVSFCVTLPVAQLAYLGRFGSFAQPSKLADSGARLTGIGVIVLTVVGTSALVASERWWNPHRRHAGARRAWRPSNRRVTGRAPATAIAGQSVTSPSSSANLAGSISRRLAPRVDAQTAPSRLVHEGRCDHRPMGGDAAGAGTDGVVEEPAHVVGPLRIAEQRRLDLGRTFGGQRHRRRRSSPRTTPAPRHPGCAPPTARRRRLPDP